MDRPPQPEPVPTPPPSPTAESGLPVGGGTPAQPGTEPPAQPTPAVDETATTAAAPQPADAESLTVPHLGEPAVPQPTQTIYGERWAAGQSATFHDPDATPAYGIRVPRPPKPADPLAVALGNASLLGVGYFLLGRKWFGIASVLVTAALVYLLLSVTPTLWFELVIVGWWVAVIVHGWALARSRTGPAPARTQRFVALGAAIPVLLAFGWLRFDAAGIEQDTADARAAGDCGAALGATGRLWFGHEVVDAPLTKRTDETVRACAELRTAGRELDAALDGDTDALAAGFEDLRGVLTGLPGHEEMVRSTVDRFLGALPVEDPCDTKAITDWLGDEKPRGAVLGDAGEIVPRIAPAAIVGCADFFATKSDWQSARQRYQQLLDEYPDHELAPKAKTGVTKATHAIELKNVRALLTPAAGSTPAYCDKPAPYSAAKPYVPKAPNRALVFGNDAHTGRIPAGWKAKDAADAVIVICAGETEFGAAVETCPYEAPARPFGYVDVTFHKIAIPLRVFEVRTGKLVASPKLQIGGASCPPILEYRSPSYVDLGPPSQVYVEASVNDVRNAFRPLLVR